MIKIVEANEGQKISYSVNKNWLNIGDQIMLNLKSREADYDVHIDITSDEFGGAGNRIGALLRGPGGYSGQTVHRNRSRKSGLQRRRTLFFKNYYQTRSRSVLYRQRDINAFRAERRCNL